MNCRIRLVFIPILVCAAVGSITVSAASKDSAASAAYFRLQSNFWVNLHHTLFQQGALRRAAHDHPERTFTTLLSESELSNPERKLWDEAVDYYARTFAGRRLLTDDQLVKINDRLSEEQDSKRLDTKGLLGEIAAELEKAAPIYRKFWWPSHDKTNLSWISANHVAEKMAPEIVGRLEKIFRHRWHAPHLVDVTYFAAEIGHAYTTDYPGHTTIASSEKDNQGLNAIETLFHEGTHTLTTEIEAALNTECKSQQKPCP